MAAKQVPVDPSAQMDIDQVDGVYEFATDVAYQRLMIVNVAYCGVPNAQDRQWVLLDTGVMGSSGAIQKAAACRFGEGSRPAAIVMTHGHFDHAGTLEELAEMWDVPVYAHELELPYLNGTAAYPEPDPSVGGGLMSVFSRFYPRQPVNVSDHLRPLPEDGSIPFMLGWRWVHVPGHTPGQIALWREDDRTLLAADAFVTTRQESGYAVAFQKPELHGPPMYYTQDWESAKASVQQLARLRPATVLTGHGPPLQGEAMRAALDYLAEEFDDVATPRQGHYVDHPTHASDGSAYRRPK